MVTIDFEELYKLALDGNGNNSTKYSLKAKQILCEEYNIIGIKTYQNALGVYRRGASREVLLPIDAIKNLQQLLRDRGEEINADSIEDFFDALQKSTLPPSLKAIAAVKSFETVRQNAKKDMVFGKQELRQAQEKYNCNLALMLATTRGKATSKIRARTRLIKAKPEGLSKEYIQKYGEEL